MIVVLVVVLVIVMVMVIVLEMVIDGGDSDGGVGDCVGNVGGDGDHKSRNCCCALFWHKANNLLSPNGGAFDMKLGIGSDNGIDKTIMFSANNGEAGLSTAMA